MCDGIGISTIRRSRQHRRRKARSFRAKHQTAIAPQIHGGQLLRPGPRMRRQTPHAPRPQRRQCFHQIVHLHQRLLEGGAHGTGNRAALERTAARLAHDQKMRAKSRAVPDHRAQIFRAGNALHGGQQQRARRIFQERFKIRLRRDFGHGQRALMQLVAGDGFQQLPFADINANLASGRARSCGSSCSSHAGVSSAETTVYRLASSRLTTLILVATSTPARSCSSTRRRVQYNASSGASRD